MIEIDKLTNVDATRVGPAAMSLIDRLQIYTPEEQAAGFALTLLLLCKKHRCRPGTALEVANNILRHAGHVSEIRAAQMYIKEEV